MKKIEGGNLTEDDITEEFLDSMSNNSQKAKNFESSIISRKLNPNVFYKHNYISLPIICYFIEHDDVDRIMLLLNNGADPYLKFDLSWYMTTTPILFALEHQKLDIANKLLNYNSLYAGNDSRLEMLFDNILSLLMLPKYRGDNDVSRECNKFIKSIIEHMCEVRSIYEKGGSLINIAVKYHNANVVRELLESGAYANKRDKNGNTPLLNISKTYPLYLSDLDILQLLLEHGADPNAIDANGRTPIFNMLIEQLISITTYKSDILPGKLRDSDNGTVKWDELNNALKEKSIIMDWKSIKMVIKHGGRLYSPPIFSNDKLCISVINDINKLAHLINQFADEKSKKKFIRLKNGSNLIIKNKDEFDENINHRKVVDIKGNRNANEYGKTRNQNYSNEKVIYNKYNSGFGEHEERIKDELDELEKFNMVD